MASAHQGRPAGQHVPCADWPLPPADGRTIVSSQANNLYIFPGAPPPPRHSRARARSGNCFSDQPLRAAAGGSQAELPCWRLRSSRQQSRQQLASPTPLLSPFTCQPRLLLARHPAPTRSLPTACGCMCSSWGLTSRLRAAGRRPRAGRAPGQGGAHQRRHDHGRGRGAAAADPRGRQADRMRLPSPVRHQAPLSAGRADAHVKHAAA